MNKHEINKEFTDYLRLNLGICTWTFEGENPTKIVPEEHTHHKLLDKFDIDESIFEYYHFPTSRLINDKEYEEMGGAEIFGKKESLLFPYSNIIYGAYYHRSDIVHKLATLHNGLIPKTIEGKEVKYFDDLIPYFKEYSKGFQDGYNEFDNTQIKPFLTIFPEKQDYINKVFEFITRKLFLRHDWLYLRSGFQTNQDGEIVNAFKNGQQQGHFYKAWFIVFSNNNLFAPLFAEHLKPSQPQQKKSKLQAKFYALYHWLKIEMGTESHFEKDEKDRYFKKRIEEYAKNKYPECSPQGFYRSFKDLDISNRTAIAKSFGIGYKDKLIYLSDNDNKVQTHLKKYPN